jgi:chemotaxis protein MotB
MDEDLQGTGGPPAEEAEEGAPAWMATFADLATLLMTFFVLLLSFATMDAQKFRDMAGSVKDAFGVQTEAIAYSAKSSSDLFEQMLKTAEEAAKEEDSEDSSESQAMMSMEQMMAIVEAVFQELGDESVEVIQDQDGVMVRVKGKVIFDSGTANLREEGKPILEMVAKLMERYRFDLKILGHTDSVGISTEKFPSNWELSGSRSSAALRYMIEQGASAERLIAVGFADSRPIASNDNHEGRSRNRRVEFLFTSPNFSHDGRIQPARP